MGRRMRVDRWGKGIWDEMGLGMGMGMIWGITMFDELRMDGFWLIVAYILRRGVEVEISGGEGTGLRR